MTNAPTLESATPGFLQPKQVCLMAALFALLGLGIGYAFRVFQGSPSASLAGARAASTPQMRIPTLDDMKQMADHQAAPLLARLKTNPNDGALLVQVAGIYHGHHQFKQAAAYYEKAVGSDPKNVGLRTQFASSLYRSGDVDGAIAQLHEGLNYDPNDANSLFNLGMILLQGKGDGKGALKVWQRLLKSNPQLSADRKAEVQKWMAEVMTTLATQPATKGVTGK